MLLRADCRVYLLIVNYTVWAAKFSLNVAEGLLHSVAQG